MLTRDAARRRGSPAFAGVLGWPLDYTLSPTIHNAAFRKLGLDWVYLAFPVPPELIGSAVAGLRSLGAMGANVTMPHKESVIDFLDDLSGDARAVGAVNTIQRLGDELIGRNTDIDGFGEFLLGDAGVDPAGRSAVVLGAGGAARAVIKALGDLRASEVTIAARDEDRARPLAELAAGSRVEVTSWARAAEMASDTDIVVNATPVGMDGRDPIPDASFGPGQVVVDLIYEPPSTPLVERARAAGADAWGGLGMLVHQAAASLRIWTGQDPPIETMSAAAVRAIGSHS
ncbi:MAG: shikimate dehydrogenase [Actinomycetota bacterium]